MARSPADGCLAPGLLLQCLIWTKASASDVFVSMMRFEPRASHMADKILTALYLHFHIQSPKPSWDHRLGKQRAGRKRSERGPFYSNA